MDAALNEDKMRPSRRHALMVTALAPVIPHILGSVFNIWYNMVIIDPLLRATGLRDRFISTVIVWNAVAYPIAVANCCAVRPSHPSDSICFAGAW